jgi:hypothetical protein
MAEEHLSSFIQNDALRVLTWKRIYFEVNRKLKIKHRPGDRHLSAKLVPTLADRGCRLVGATDPHGR